MRIIRNNKSYEVMPIDGYHGYYSITQCGKVFTHNRSRFLSTKLNQDGYVQVVLFKRGKRKVFLVHRLVGYAFIDNPENKPQINHINGIKVDNRKENLEWCTIQENITHSIDMGLKKSSLGEDHGISKLTNKQVLDIHEQLSNGIKQIALVKKYKVGRGTISDIKLGKTWSW